MRKKAALLPLALLCLSAGGLSLTGCRDQQTTAAASTAPDVVVAVVTQGPVTMTNELPGRTVASRIAEIRPQVSGIILRRDFTEGSDVQAGTALYHIDPAPFKATEASARAAVAQAEAQSQLAQATLSRYRALSGGQYISRQDYDQAVATARQSRAAIDAAKASLDSARIDLGHSVITSPLSGRIGLSSVTEGALVENGQTTAMATVQQLDPIYVDITQPGDAYLRLQQSMANGQLTPLQGKAPIQVLMQDGSEYPLTGTLAFSDVTVDQTTGAITLRAIVPNPKHQLLPGMFVRARITEGTTAQAILVPQQAVTRTPRGDATALVVKPDNTVEQRALTLARAIGDQWQVTEGLRAGDRIIVEGLQRAKAGEKVTPHSRETQPAAPSSASQGQS